MSMSDTIGDMLTRIRNGQKSKLINIYVNYSKVKLEILKVLQSEGYINEFKIIKQNSFDIIEVGLKYLINGQTAIKEIKRMSTPGKRIYSSLVNLKKRGCYNNLGIYILSTSKGMVSHREAYLLKVGGEVICKVF